MANKPSFESVCQVNYKRPYQEQIRPAKPSSAAVEKRRRREWLEEQKRLAHEFDL